MDSGIKGAYQSAELGADDRMILEKEMLIQATIPPLLISAIKNLFATISELKEEINVAELYFTDTSALGLYPRSGNSRKEQVMMIDAMRKVELKRGVAFKRCTKCGNLTEDVPLTRGSNMAVLQLQRHCLCGGWWMVLDEEEQGGAY